MKRGMRAWTGLAALLALAVGAGETEAQWTRTDDAGCEDRWGGRDRDRFCMVLEGEFDDAGRVVLDGGMNGGVQVEGWSRSGVEVRAMVWANARSAERAREIADDVRVSMRDGRLRADGPDTGRSESWGVSWEVTVPYETDLDIETMNGGIGVTDVQGEIVFRAQNGGVHLAGVGGDVSGRTTNGGVHVELDGRRWDGAGLDVETTNGGVTLAVPADYSARLETGTVNGGMELDFPVTVQGRIGKRLSTTLGDGGPPVRAVTTNGGVRISRAGSAIR
jgi:hypothetical protein